jgi:hypothetical protein
MCRALDPELTEAEFVADRERHVSPTLPKWVRKWDQVLDDGVPVHRFALLHHRLAVEEDR